MLERLYPGYKEHGWMPVIWLMYLIFFFIDPFLNHQGLLVWTGTIVAGAVFILLYLRSYTSHGRTAVLTACAMVLMGIVCTPWNSGAMGFFIYAAATVPWLDQSRRVWLWLAIIIAIIVVEARLLHLPNTFALMMSFFSLTTAAANFYFAQKRCAAKKLQLAQDEVEHLAKVAERERIARDLHDLLGHTLSLITLKAELARKLVDRDLQRAKQEMLDVEHTSRAALADVREAISGYRGQGLAAELIRARKTLETAGITVDCEFAELPLTPAQETVLALALREAVTNVVRHAQAQQCKVRLQREDNLCMLEITDNGRGASGPEGNGLRGMRERLEAIGGSLQRQTKAGTRLVIHLPLAPAAPALRN
jgi:two-component system, NarL family, sensor histidine kinase DesK